MRSLIRLRPSRSKGTLPRDYGPPNGGTIERMVGHSNAKTTGLYDRREDDISVGREDRDLKYANCKFVGSQPMAITVSLIAILIGISCSRKDLSRPLAAQLILHHEQERYSDECTVDFLASPDAKDQPPGVLALHSTLGASICAYTVDVTGISLTSEAVREVVFNETKDYDATKLAALTSFVDTLFARLSALPVEAVADTTFCRDKNPKCSQYHFAVIDPIDGEECVLDSMSKTAGVKLLSRSSPCDCLGAVIRETAVREARTKHLTIDDVWAHIPTGLYRHRQRDATPTVTVARVARLQLFDDGWRVLDISPPT